MGADGCRRFEEEILPSLIAGEQRGVHLDDCAECRAALAEYEQLTSALARVDAAARPRPDWQARVLAAVARKPQPSRRARWTVALSLSLAAAAMLLIVGRRSGREEPSIQVEVSHGPSQLRGAAGQAAPGDRLLVRAATGGKSGELRVYRDDRELVARCGRDPVCDGAPRHPRVELRLPSVGRYRVVLVIDPPAQPVSGATMDDDLSALRAAGARVELGPTVEVW
jgi:hypothetical protein